MNFRTQKGFTLIELMIVLAVAAIVLTVAVPSMATFIQNNRLVTEGNDFRVTLHVARSEAVKRGTAVTITASDSSDNTNEWGPGWTITTNGGTNLQSHAALDGQSTLNSIDNINSIQFLPTGFTAAGAQRSFLLCDDRSGAVGKLITITASGRATTQSGANCP